MMRNRSSCKIWSDSKPSLGNPFSIEYNKKEEEKFLAKPIFSDSAHTLLLDRKHIMLES